MTYDYSRAVATAKRLLAKFGRTIQHQAIGASAYNDETGAVEQSTTNTDVKACDFDFDDKGSGQIYQSDSLVQAGDRYALIGAEVGGITTADKLIIDGVTYNIINVKKLAPGGVLVLWTVHIRK